jgi:hypothetical protein
MIKKFLSKYILEVIPSILATVVGAYIVTHYINAKSDDKPKAAISAPAETSKNASPQTPKTDESTGRAAKESPKAEADRLKAEKLEAEKAFAERAAADRAQNAKKAAEKLAAEKAEKLAGEKLASEKAAAEKREKAVAKSAPVMAPAAEAHAAPNDRRDANDLARAAIERLRNAKASEKTSEPTRGPEAARAEELPRPQERARVNSVVYAPAAAPQPSIQPLPPAVTVAPPPSEAAVMAPPQPFPAPMSGSSESAADDGLRLTPPADIPARPLDLRTKQGRSSVTEDVVSAAKSVFHAVVPESSN